MLTDNDIRQYIQKTSYVYNDIIFLYEKNIDSMCLCYGI